MYFEEWPTRLIVSEDLYNACEIGTVIHKSPKTLDLGVQTIHPVNFYAINLYRRNCGTTSETMALLFLGFLTTLTRDKTDKKAGDWNNNCKSLNVQLVNTSSNPMGLCRC